MTDFDAGDVVELGYGVRLRAVEVSGQAGDARPSPLEGTPVRDAEPADPTDFLADAGSVAPDELGQAILVSGMRLRVTIPFDELVSPQNQPVEPQRGPVDVPHLEIEVEAPEHQDEGQVILEVDNTGHIRWHYPRDAEVANSLERRPGTQVFDIPVERFELPGQMGFSTARGVLGFGVRKVLHLIRFPIERLAEVAVHHMVRWWEQRHRGYQLTLLGEDPRLLVDTDRLAALADKPLLLLVHGTFSTGDAFRQLYSDQQWLANIRKRYGGVLIFDHPSMHVAPEDNARWLLDQLPTDRTLTLDVVSHSRGGLVARQIPLQSGVACPPRIRRLVQVGPPNAGTVL
ncbi:esterase/lipase family protein, partial [Kibdelosporangium lantanae]